MLQKNLPILTDAGFLDTTGDINVEIMMKMSIHFLIAILLPFDGLFSPPVLHSFVCMIFAQYRNYSQITCEFCVTLSKAKWLGNCVYTCLKREKKSWWPIIRSQHDFFSNKNAFQIFCLCQMAVILKQDIAKDRNVHDVFNVF